MKANKKKLNLIFDFDGVILNSNLVKTEAFKKISESFGYDNSKKLLDYHLQNGGVSRFKKIRWFVENILEKNDDILINELVHSYGLEVSNKLLECELRTDLLKLKKNLQGTFWSIASGGLEEEIITYLQKKSFLKIFDSGVYGSPTTKMEIIKNIKANGQEKYENQWVLIGDSIYDFKCAKSNDINFIFASEWSEIKNPKDFINKNSIKTITGIEQLNINFFDYLLE